MQTIKDSTRRDLINVAREAFCNKGFSEVSMREISQKSKVCLSNIYNYFPGGKEDLLEAVLSPILKALNGMIQSYDSPEIYKIGSFFSADYYRETLQWMVSLATNYRKEFKLLLFAVQKTRFESYFELWSQKSLSLGIAYLDKMKQLYPQINTDISHLFLRYSCSWWINMLKEIVLHEELSREDIECFINEYIQFTSGGWIKLMKLQGDILQIFDFRSSTFSTTNKKYMYE